MINNSTIIRYLPLLALVAAIILPGCAGTETATSTTTKTERTKSSMYAR